MLFTLTKRVRPWKLFRKYLIYHDIFSI
jgi:hypothetical protein